MVSTTFHFAARHLRRRTLCHPLLYYSTCDAIYVNKVSFALRRAIIGESVTTFGCVQLVYS